MRDGLRGDDGSEAPDHLHPLADILHAYQELFGSSMVAAHAHPPPAEPGGGGAPPPAAPGGGRALAASRGKSTRTFAMPLPHILEQRAAPQAPPRRPVFLAERNKKGCAVVTNLGDAIQVYKLRHISLWGCVVG